jgi:hypothetical protein
MNKLISLLAAAALAMTALGVDAAIPKAAENENDSVGVAADVPKPGRAKAVATMKAAKSAKAREAEKKPKESKNLKHVKPAQKPARRA